MVVVSPATAASCGERMSYGATEENHSTLVWIARRGERRVMPAAMDHGAWYRAGRPACVLADRRGGSVEPETEASNTTLPLSYNRIPGLVNVAPSSHPGGRQATASLASSRPSSYSSSCATNDCPDAP